MATQHSTYLSTMLLAIGLSLAVVSAANATDKTDLMVSMKTLPVLQNRIKGDAMMAIIYDPAVPESKTDAEAIKSAVDDGLEAPPGVKLIPTLVSTNDLGKLSSARIAFLAQGLPASSFDAIAKAATPTGVITFSTDLACVRAHKCILGVVSKPGVEIYYSKSAADASNIGFVQAFTMLAKQI